jgi:predicted RNA binding protein YcfA (HicA-like mRNA interferase family)
VSASLPRTLNQRSAIKLLQEHGWTHVKGGKGSHAKMEKPGFRPVILPHRSGGRDYSPAFTARILRQAGLR